MKPRGNGRVPALELYGALSQLCRTELLNRLSTDHTPVNTTYDFFLQVDANVFWKILSVPGKTNLCEKEFDVNKLKRDNKIPLVCLSLPSKVRNTPPRVFKSQKARILAGLQN